MTWRSLAGTLLAGCCVALAVCPAVQAATEDGTPEKPAAVKDTPVEETNEPAVRYLPLDAPAGMSQAVVVRGLPLVYTRQLLPLDSEGKLVGEGSADEQIEQVLTNLEAVLGAAGSGLDKLVRLNVCALSHQAADRLREQLTGRLDPAVRPAITVLLTPLGHRKALVAVDAVAVAAEKGEAVALQRCEAVAGDKDCADAAVMPPGGVAYLSGQPEKGGLAMSAVAQSLSTLLGRLGQLKLSPSQVVQVKVFLTPATSADAALREVKKLFPGQLTPPVVFVEWIASAPVEIELVAQLPLTGQPAETVEYYNPPEVRPSPAFSRVALVRTERQIHISGLSAREAGDGEAQARDVFDQLQSILAKTGGDMLHLAKATYYVSDDDGSRGIDILRRESFDPQRPPAASKVTVHGVGQPDRTLTIDLIAVGSGP
ncbi:MAG TPA: Rid family hydrolase [Thermoguttaceae bacterium]|nr:Rid family hydrolase [Thermoguttaceae bacterium]